MEPEHRPRRRRLRAQPAHLAVRCDHDLARDADVGRIETNVCPSPGRGFTQIHPSSGPLSAGKQEGHLHGGAGWDHVRGRRSRRAVTSPLSVLSATNSVAGSELLLSTVTVQHRAFGGTGPAAGGNGVGTGVGLGKTGGGGLGKAGNGGGDTPAGTYSSAAPVGTQSPLSLHSLPPATRTVPSSRSVNEPLPHRGMLEARHPRPGARVVQRRSGTGPRRRYPAQKICHQHSAIRQQRCRSVAEPGSLGEFRPGSGGRVVVLGVELRTAARP